MELNNELIVVDRNMLNELQNRVRELECKVSEISNSNTFNARVDRYATGGIVTSASVCKVMNWSARTLRRRLENNEIPMVKDGGRWIISVDEFIKWHATTFNQ